MMPFDWTKTLGVLAVGTAIAAGPALAQDSQNSFNDWNSDQQAGINSDERNAGFGENGVFDDWDADGDGTLSKDEFNDGVFQGYDDNDDDLIDDQEFAEYEEEEQGFWDI